nr:MAG TPA: hypothetical protein [Caudoviricetes sp.]
MQRRRRPTRKNISAAFLLKGVRLCDSQTVP